ncbi:hypothetical protein ASE04_29670 [Rhizobium sp. Root708]|nr:hypothetical protein ASE04_29670 [Rhizobium sp. Root708]
MTAVRGLFPPVIFVDILSGTMPLPASLRPLWPDGFGFNATDKPLAPDERPFVYRLQAAVL